MEKKNFITLVFGVIGGLLFSLGMCMALLEEWAMFNEGVILGTIGAVLLLLTWLIYRKLSGKKAKKINWKTVAKTIYGIFAALVFGSGMSMIMVYDLMLYGIIVGVVGIVLLLFLIPMCLGFKDSKKAEKIEEN